MAILGGFFFIAHKIDEINIKIKKIDRVSGEVKEWRP